MKHKKFFRMTSVVLISILCVCGLSMNVYASDHTDTAQTEETTSEPIIIKPENAFTPDGNMTLIDNVEGEEEGEKQFIIVQSKNGHYFYIVIDYATNGENTVHFLNQVDEADLMTVLAEEEIILAPAECICAEKCIVGDIDTACPLCIATMTECAGEETIPPADEPEPPSGEDKKGIVNMGMIVTAAVFVVFAVVSIFYYLKVLKPKQQKSKQPQSAELADLEYDEFDEDEEYPEVLEETADDIDEEEEGSDT